MTRNQIEYWKNQESKRHSLEMEQQGRDVIAETKRHNVKSEGQTDLSIAETGRHNKATESETYRHNYAGELETNRHNVATENIDLSKLAEVNRHNLVTEGQGQQRINLDTQLGYAQLGEIRRHNQATESLTGTDLNIRGGQLEETVRHNQSTELMQSDLNQSIKRLNNANAAVNEINAEYRGLQEAMNLEVNAAKAAQLRKLIDQLDAQMDLLTAQTYRQEQDAAFKTYEEVLKLIDSSSKLIDSVIPF